MHLLLVSDIPHRLHALEHDILEKRPDWDVVALGEAAELPQVLRSRPFDVVIVCGASGTAPARAMLEDCARAASGAIRFVTASDPRDAEALAQLDLAHRIKPTTLSVDHLVATLDQVDRLAALLDDPRLRREIASFGRLPAPPGVALSIMQASADPDFSLARVIDLLRGHPVITAKVLQLSNSSLYSRGAPVTDLQQALMRLGLDQLVGVVLAAEAFSAVGSQEDQARLQARALMGAQLATRILRGLGTRIGALKPGTVLTAVTLAEIGRLLPLRREVVERLFAAEGGGEELPPAHSIMGAYLLLLWGLPREIVTAVAWQARPLMAREDGFGAVAATHVAHALAAGLPLDESLLESLGLGDAIAGWADIAERIGAPPRPANRRAGDAYEIEFEDADFGEGFTFL